MSMSPPAGVDERNRKLMKRALLIGLPLVALAMTLALLVALPRVVVSYTNKAQSDLEALRNPFIGAITDLRYAEGVVYGDATYAGTSVSDMTVTRSGMQLGVLGFDGGGPLGGLDLPEGGAGGDDLGEMELLHVEGKTFFRARGAEMPWTTGSVVDDIEPMLETFWTPKRLADSLGERLARTDRADLIGEGAAPSVASLGDRSVLRADLGGDSLLVSKAAPHHLVAIVPADVIDATWVQESAPLVSGPADEGAGLSAVGFSSSGTGGPLGTPDEGMSIEPVPAEGADPMYDQFEEPINELPKAVDSDIDFSLSPSGSVSCSTGGCTVNQQIAGSVSATSPDAQVSGGQVNATMVANFTIDGGGAGSCMASGTFPLIGGAVSGSLSCSNPGAGPVMAAAIQTKKAALGPRGGRYQVAYSAQTNVTAMAVVSLWVKKAKAALNSDRRRAQEAVNAVGRTLGDTSKIEGWVPRSIPKNAQDAIKDIAAYGVDGTQGRAGTRGFAGPNVPREFMNSGKSGGYVLPRTTASGDPITYREWGVWQSLDNPRPGGERIVTGSDGSIYYTPTHYQSYIVAQSGR